MQQLVEVRRRMKSVATIGTVSRTMATVSSAKLSRTRQRAAGMRLYADRLRDAIRRQQQQSHVTIAELASLSPFLVPRPAQRIALVHLSGDRGMCGNYNTSANREAVEFLAERERAGVPVDVFAKGLHGARYLVRRTDAELVGAEGWLRAGVTGDEVDAMHERVTGWFMSRDYDEVWCVYTRFVSPVRRYPHAVRLLPLSPEDIAGEDPGPRDAGDERWFHEPDVRSILAAMLEVFLRLQIEDVLLESYAAEQGARMITMQEAAERADKTLQELTVRHNRLRRESITGDLLGVLLATRLREAESESGGIGVGTVM